MKKIDEFSIGNATHMAIFAELIYQIKTDIPELTVGDHTYALRYIDSPMTDVQAAVAWTGDHIIITVRGTEPRKLRDWLTNFEYHRFQTGHGYAFHRGFQSGCISIIYTTLSILGRIYASCGPLPIFITGHSAGAAIGTILTDVLLHNDAHHVRALYTFGSPRVGCLRFRQSFHARFQSAYRLVNNNDIVPRMPPQSMGYLNHGVPWSHVGHLYYFDHDGQLMDGSDLSWWAGFWDRLGGRLDGIGDACPDGLADHPMANYLRLCRNAADPQIIDLIEDDLIPEGK